VLTIVDGFRIYGPEIRLDLAPGDKVIHKSQGSEYPAVVIPVRTQHYTMLQRNLLYTGVTRGKRLVVLVGQKKAVGIAVRSVSGRRRWSKLREWLQPPDYSGVT
jgi:exodeoxyribonuclease V alpha subunit